MFMMMMMMMMWRDTGLVMIIVYIGELTLKKHIACLCLFLSECFAHTSYWCEGGCCGVEVGWVLSVSIYHVTWILASDWLCLCRFIDPMPALAEQGWLTQEYIQPRITKKHQCHYHYHSIISLSLSLCQHHYLYHHHYVSIISSEDSHCQRLILGYWVSHI